MGQNNLKSCFKDVSETTNIYFNYLHLCYFFDGLSKRQNLTHLARDINVTTENRENYLFRGSRINSILNEMNSKPEKQSMFLYLNLINSIRGICMALFESFANEQFKTILLEEIFNKDAQNFLNFQGVIRFVRNTLSHNIRDKISINEEDYKRQKEWWEKNGSPDNTKIHFEYDYSERSSAIYNSDYNAKINVLIEWNLIKDKTPFGEIIPTFQNIMLAEFCNNIIVHLDGKNILSD